MCTYKILSIDPPKNFPAQFCAELFEAAEREMSAYLCSVDQLFDDGLTQQAADYWIEALETLEPIVEDVTPNWRQVTIAATAHLAKRFNLNSTHFVQDRSVGFKGSGRNFKSNKDRGRLQPASGSSDSSDHDAASLERGQRFDNVLSAFRELRSFLEDREE